MEISIHLWYICALADRYACQWNSLFDEGLAFIKREFPRVPVIAWRTSRMWISNVKSPVYNGIPNDLMGVNAFLWEMIHHIVKTCHGIFSPTNWNNFYFYLNTVLLHAIYNILLDATTDCESQATMCDICRLWHWNWPRHALDWCQLFWREIWCIGIDR